jgi:hypothetical protein
MERAPGRHSKGGDVDLHPLVRLEWRDDHRLSRRSLLWIHEHAEPGDPQPITTAIAQLRAELEP